MHTDSQPSPLISVPSLSSPLLLPLLFSSPPIPLLLSPPPLLPPPTPYHGHGHTATDPGAGCILSPFRSAGPESSWLWCWWCWWCSFDLDVQAQFYDRQYQYQPPRCCRDWCRHFHGDPPPPSAQLLPSPPTLPPSHLLRRPVSRGFRCSQSAWFDSPGRSVSSSGCVRRSSRYSALSLVNVLLSLSLCHPDSLEFDSEKAFFSEQARQYASQWE